MTDVAFADFARLAKKRQFNKSDLAGSVRDWWESGSDSPQRFADRVFSPLFAAVAIPYLPLLKLYCSWINPHETPVTFEKLSSRRCFCGCGAVILAARKRFASAACQRKHHRLAKNKEQKPMILPT